MSEARKTAKEVAEEALPRIEADIKELQKDEFALINEYDVIKRHLTELIAARDRSWDEERTELRRELAIAFRVCGNWREFPNAPNAEVEKDWQYSLRAIVERDRKIHQQGFDAGFEGAESAAFDRERKYVAAIDLKVAEARLEEAKWWYAQFGTEYSWHNVALERLSDNRAAVERLRGTGK